MIKKFLFLATILCCDLALAVEKEAPTPTVTVTCEQLLSVLPASPEEILSVLRLFPNETVKSVVPFVSKKPKKNEAPTPFQQAITKAAGAVSFSDFRYLPISIYIANPGGLDGHIAMLDLNHALGKTVVGHADLVGKPNAEGLYPVERQYFAGVVVGVTHETHAYPAVESFNGYEIAVTKLTISTPEGVRREIMVRGAGPMPAVNMLLVSPATNEASLLREAMQASSIESILERNFGSPMIPEDYSMASAIVDTILSVPPQAGSTTIVKILMGHKVKDSEQYPYFGIALGKARYSEDAIRMVVASMSKYMQILGVLPNNEKIYYLPEETKLTHKVPLSETFQKIWRDIKSEKGAGDLEIGAAKSRTISSLTLSKSNAVPGMKLIAVEGFAAADLMGGTKLLTVAPGTKLILLTKPRKKSEINVARVRVADTGEEGEFYWIYLTKGTKIDLSQESGNESGSEKSDSWL